MKNTKHYLILAALAIIFTFIIQSFDIAFPHPSQKAGLKPQSVIPILILASICSILWDKFIVVHPPVITMKYLWFAAIGALIGLLFVFIDMLSGISKQMANLLNISSIHMELPFSGVVYSIAAVIVESLYRIIPIGILFWLISTFILKSKNKKQIYIILAIIISGLEPLSQLAVFQTFSVVHLVLGILIYSFNLLLCYLIYQYGIFAAVLTRWSFYMVWHVLIGPVWLYN
ncbi:MAG TPA: hypothetical protein PKC30_06815 [Saprospiraceae bacterium]|nr:hypothetical protein [Saprospiraceae bacterium]